MNSNSAKLFCWGHCWATIADFLLHSECEASANLSRSLNEKYFLTRNLFSSFFWGKPIHFQHTLRPGEATVLASYMLRRTTAFQHDPRSNYSSLVYCLTPNDYSVPFSNASLRSSYKECHVFPFYITISDFVTHHLGFLSSIQQ
jgi:hypothetical protein